MRNLCGYNRKSRYGLKNFKKFAGQKIQARRIELRLTQGDIANELDINNSRVSEWENGVHLPYGQNRKNLLKILKTDESLIDIDPFSNDMKVAQLKKENVLLLQKISLIEPEVFETWNVVHPGKKAICLRLLTGKKRFVAFLADGIEEQIAALLRLLGLEEHKPQ